MEISLQTKLFLGINAVVGAVNAYQAPYPWLTGFAMGYLAAYVRSSFPYSAVINGEVIGNRWGMGGDETTDREIRAKGIKYFFNEFPGVLTTALNALALLIIFKLADFLEPYGSKYADSIIMASAIDLGYTTCNLLTLEKLSRHKEKEIVHLFKDVIV